MYIHFLIRKCSLICCILHTHYSKKDVLLDVTGFSGFLTVVLHGIAQACGLLWP